MDKYFGHYILTFCKIFSFFFFKKLRLLNYYPIIQIFGYPDGVRSKLIRV